MQFEVILYTNMTSKVYVEADTEEQAEEIGMQLIEDEAECVKHDYEDDFTEVNEVTA